MELVHEAFHEQDAVGIGRFDHGPDLGGVHGHGLLTEDVLAGAHGPDGPLGMEVVRERVIDRVDGRVVDELLVGLMGPREAEPSGPILSPGLVARSDAGEDAVPGLEDGRDEGLLGDPRASQDAPTDLPIHARPPSGSDLPAAS